MKKLIVFGIAFISFLSGCSNQGQNNSALVVDSRSIVKKNGASNVVSDNEWKIAKIEGKTLLFTNGQSFKTGLFDLKYIGQLKTRNKTPYFILSGRSCKNCDENLSIYIWSSSDGPMKSDGSQPRYSYPGKEEDYLTNELVYENRMFYGNCLGKEGCIWIQKSLSENKTWESNVFIVQVQNDTLKEIKINESDRVKEISSKAAKCIELPGIVTTTEP